MSDAIWEVVGGADKGGIKVREGRDLQSKALNDNLSTGARVKQLELIGDRLHFQRLTGVGPNSGWVSTNLKGKELLVKVSGGGSDAAADSTLPPIAPLYEQTPGKPYVFNHMIAFLDTKPTGLRMSSCFGIMDETRCEAHTLCDNSVEGIRDVSDPHIEIAMELCPAILQLSDKVAPDGMMYQHPKSKGAVQSWVRDELTYGFPNFPFKTETQQLYLVGKRKESSQRIPIATAKFAKALVDAETNGLADEGKVGAKVDKFFAKLKSDHSSAEVAGYYPLKKAFEAKGKAFAPTVFKKIKWLMPYHVGDLWGRFYHAKSPETCWDLNMLAGGKFADLVKEEPDPQSLVASLSKQMEMGTTFDVLCFLEEARQKAVYILMSEGGSKVSDVYLSLTANYKWKGIPEDGKTLCAEDLDAIAGMSRTTCLKYAAGEDFKSTKALDLSNLPKQ